MSINKAANAAKHNSFIKIGLVPMRFDIDQIYCPGRLIKLEIPPSWDWNKNRMQMGICASDTYMQINMKVEMITILEDNIGAASNKSLILILKKYLDITSSFSSDFLSIYQQVNPPPS